MNAIYKYTLMSLLGIALLTACSEDRLETSPSTAVATGEMTLSSSKAIAAIDGMYRFLYMYGYTSGWQHEEFGLSAINLAADLMGEDHIQAKSGSGWFYYDYLYDVKGDFSHNQGRPYGVWNFFYTLISNANYVTSAEDTMEGSSDDVKYVVGQAYAIRAFSYFMLAQWYARTLVGHENEPCVPIYTEPTTKETQGKPRETTAKVYEQIDADIAKAEALLSATSRVRESKSHLGLAEIYGLKARIAQVEEKWDVALTAATNAISEASSEGVQIASVSQFAGLNNVSAANVMWGMKIISDQATMYASFFTHMDKAQGKYGASAPQQISRSLYAKMGEKDERRAWWNPEDADNGDNGYQQEKFKFLNYQTWEGDYIFMRIEEMYLVKAEAECMLGQDDAAQQTLNTLIGTRDKNYECTKTGKDLGKLTSDKTNSLREEIINQRRIELWGEFGRIYDIRRLHQGFERKTEDGHPSSAVDPDFADPESYKWVMVIPQSEFDGNVNMDLNKDQNPFD
ncbi:MAG: RagB/SusD family nutrient uptake outer membrane protein [Prevotella sp.]|nr:RagB/SusD family nutrient uptake outer membrane protein [Prevotella sp.]